ncbi:hypothetical protein GETHLI_28630 [Geothrix limicola]|uniref:histidine kinase n=1 Tax=Geothrix limicola TaxID=2927978 RepID=A0ABQ5QJ00_9BACT|nr:ATP-binding protein [Geothrix limicola]GLH74361.1 hypothetical protein GETHLI_28630 [Geothrix limicola]
MSASFRLRLIVPLLLGGMAVASSLLFMSLYLRQEMALVRTQTAESLEVQTFVLRNSLSDLAARGDWELAERRFMEAALDPRVEAMVLVDPEDKVRFSTERQWIGSPAEALEGFRDAKVSPAPTDPGRLHPVADTRLIGAFPIDLGVGSGSLRAQHRGRLFVAYDLSLTFAQARHQMRIQAAWIVGLWLLAAVLLFLLLDALITRKVDRLLHTMGLIEGGDLKARSGLEGGDELSRLGGAFDQLLDQIAANQTELRESREFLDAILENLPIILFVKDARDLRYVRLNKAGEELLGRPREEMIGKSDSDFFPPDQAAFFGAKDRAVLAEKRLLDIPLERIQTRSRGERLLHTRKIPLLDAQGTPRYLLGIAEDITDRRRAESERARLQAQLQQTQKMESLGSLAGGVAHDMNNVLGAILGLASAHGEHQPPGSPTRRAFETIIKAAERGGKMVKSLLSFARQNPAEEQELDMNTILREETSLLERTTLAKVRLEMTLDPALRPIRGDASALSHALMNLCVNAVDAMPDRGTLTLRTRNLDSGWIEIEVGDTGCGMPEDVLKKALDPFFTTKPAGKGTGLGLSMVYSTVNAHHGQMEIQSEPGLGTRVSLRFPAAEPSRNETGALPEGGTGPSQALSVLLVDDDDLVRASTQALLESLGHAALAAPSGEAALAELESGARPDLVILDMNMPGLSGAGTLPRLRALRPEVPILLATGQVDQAALALIEAYPRVTLLAKPFDRNDLLRHLHDL